jgi:amino acid adenylation domain-containing protein
MDITSPNRGRILVSSNQSALWFLYKLSPESCAYNMHFACVLGRDKGQLLALDQLEESFYQAVHLQHTMRTGYFQEGREVKAKLFAASCAEFTCERKKLTEQAHKNWVNGAADQPFCLEKGYVIRANVRIDQDVSYLVVTAHHIAGDFYAMERFMQTWAECYLHLVGEGEAPQVKEPFADWLERQEDWLSSEQASNTMQFWKETIGSLPESLHIPADFERPKVIGFTGDQCVCHADAELSDDLLQAAKALKTTPYVLLLSAFQYFLYRLSDQKRFLIGSPTSGRRGRRDREVVGYCANPIPVLADFSEDTSFAELIQKNANFFTQARPHQRLPFAKLSQVLLKERSAEKSGLTNHMMTYTQMHDTHFATPIMGDMLQLGQRGAAHELHLGVFKTQAGKLDFIWRFNTSLYRADTVAAMAQDFFALLRCLLAAPGERLSIQTASLWLDQTSADSQSSETSDAPCSALALWKKRSDDEIALLQGDKRILVGEVNQAAERLISNIKSQKARIDSPIAILLPRGERQVAAMLAAWKLGVPYVPLDDKLPSARLQLMLREVPVSACIGLGDRPDFLPETSLWLDMGEDISSASYVLPSVSCEQEFVDENDTAYLIFTSGSTGTPKAVAVSQGALASYVEAVNERLNLPAGSVYASLASIATDLSYTALWGGLLGGYPVRILDEEWMLDAEGLADHLQTHPVDMLKVVPSHLQGLLASERLEILPRKALVLGGEGVTPELVKQLQQQAPERALFNHYGPTETTVGVMAGKLEAGAPISLGTALAGNRLYVLSDAMLPTPVGGIGQLYVAGRQLAQGYWQNEEKTAHSFIDNPFVLGEKLYRTGDRVRRLPNQHLAFVGRGDGQVKIRGYRVELAEIEHKLAQLPGVMECAVHFDKIEQRECLVAFVVSTQSIKDIEQALAQVVPAYMMPHFWQKLDVLPRNSNGKIDRKTLRERANQYLSEQEGREEKEPENHASSETQDNTLVQALQALFAKVLQLEESRVDKEAGFFALGGDSILALQLVAAARKDGLPLTPQLIFQHQTAAALGAFLQTQAPAKKVARPATVSAKADAPVSTPNAMRRSSTFLPDSLTCGEVHAPLSQQDLEQVCRLIAPDTIEDILPLSPGQQGIFYHCQLDNNPGLYTNVTTLSLEGELEVSAFLQAWKQAGLRHDILRSQFVWESLEQPVMVVRRDLAMQTDFQDWQAFSAQEQEARLADFLAEEERNGFVISQAPLMRITLIRFSHDAWRLIWTRHHLVVDGWTSALVAGEAIALYQKKSLAPAPTLAAYSAWLLSQDEDAALRYWQEALMGVEEATILSDHQTKSTGENQQSYRLAQLPVALSEQVQHSARQHDVTVNTLVQLAWALTLNRFTGRTDVVFGTTSSGRSEAVDAIQQTAGMFMNTLPQRVILKGEQTLAEQARALQLSAAEARQAEHLSLAQIQSSLSLPPGEALFDTVLVYQNYPISSALTQLETPKIHLLYVAEHSNLPLMLQVEPGESLCLHCRYDRQRLADDTVTALLATFEQALEGLTQGLDQTVHALLGKLVGQEKALSMVSGQSLDRTQYQDLLAQIQHWGHTTPDKHALIAEERNYTYKALCEAITQRSAYFTDRLSNVSELDKVVAVALARDAQLVINLLALYQAGISYIPLDPSHPKERLESILEQAKVAFMLVTESLSLDVEVEQISLAQLQLEQEDSAIQNAGDLLPIPSDSAIAYRIFTSGSTGKPKGVEVSRGALKHFMHVIADEVPVSKNSRLLAVTTVGFDIAALELILPLLQGGTLVLVNDENSKDGQALAQLIDHHQINVMQATPATWLGLVEYDVPWWQTLDVLVGGEALPVTLARTLLNKANSLTNLYGPTEATIWVSCEKVTPASLDNLNGNHVALGHPLANTALSVLDNLGYPVRPGVEGELYIGGYGLAQGYLNLPELTAEKFVPVPFAKEVFSAQSTDLESTGLKSTDLKSTDLKSIAPDFPIGEKLYRTGDRVRMDQNKVIHYLGRMDFQVKLRGFRIELGEIDALLQQHPSVREAVTLMWDEQPDKAFIAAYVSLVPPQKGQAEADLMAYLGEHLPAYMVPAHIQILDSLPLNTNGKINRRALSCPTLLESTHYECPQTEVEHTLAEIWQQILSVKDPSVRDNFFHLGGNSLSATRLQARIQRAFHISLSLADIFQNPTIKALAEKLDVNTSQEDDLAAMAALLDEFEL